MRFSACSVALTLVLIPATSLVSTGCGSPESERAEFEAAAARCETVPIDGSYDKVHLENSAISCQQATAMIYLLSTGSSSQTVTTRGEGRWTCVILPHSKRPLEARCHRGQRYFTVERR